MNIEPPKVIILCPMHPTSWSWFLKFYKILEANELNPILFNDTGYKVPQGYSQVIMNKSIKTSFTSLEVFYSERSNLFKLIYRKIRLIVNKLKSNILSPNKIGKSKDKKIKQWILDQKTREGEIIKLINNHKPKAFFLVGDRNGRYVPAIIKVAPEKKIKLIIPPIAYVASKHNLAKKTFRFNDPDHILNEKSDAYIKENFPNQYYKDPRSGKCISFFKSWEIKARHKNNNLVKNPWIIGSSDVVTICVNSQMEKDRLIKSKVNKENIIIAGSIEYDSIYINFSKRSSIKKNVYKKYSLDKRKKLIILGLPVMWEHGLGSREDTLKIYDDYCKIAKKTNYNMLISLHPKCKKYNYSKFLKRQGIRVFSESLSDVISIADLYVTGQGSNTGFWSIVCEVPLVISDYYGMNYNMYNRFKEVKVSKTYNDFKDTILNISSNSELRNLIRKDFRKSKYLISRFDGKNQSRIIRQIC